MFVVLVVRFFPLVAFPACIALLVGAVALFMVFVGRCAVRGPGAYWNL